MIYNSFNFILLFPLLFCFYYLIPAKRLKWRNGYLLLVSYLLYANWKPAYALILLGVTLVTYLFARWIDDEKRSLKIVVGGALLTLLPLLIFKYYNFINDSIFDLLSKVGLRFRLPGLNWAIPMGISFFTFQSLGYMLDVYHQRIRAERDFLSYALFVSFFPSIVAGPINKANLVIPQLKALRPYFDYGKAVTGLKMLLWGMFMKVVVADRVALYVDTVFSSYMNYTGVTCFVASLLYTIQIYADFAGYSLMALGVGKTLGFELTENFRRPYFSISITDFWHRWHISLSTWLKDYVYIPLGGSRCSKIRNYWNIFVTFLVSGVWHGANWTFIVWGCIHGVLQIIEKIFGLQQLKSTSCPVRIGRILITFLLVNFAWIFFRMPTLDDSFRILGRILTIDGGFSIYMAGMRDSFFMVFGLFLLFFKDTVDEFFPAKKTIMENKHTALRWFGYLFIITIIMLTGVFDAGQFIYANF